MICEQVMRDPHGISKGSGFVAFSTPEEASRAVSLYVFYDDKKFTIKYVQQFLYFIMLKVFRFYKLHLLQH